VKLLLYLGCPPAERPEMDVLLRSAGFAVRWVDGAKQALAALDERIAPVVVDLASPHAIPVAIEVRSRNAAALIVGIEDRRQPDASERARRAGLVHLLERPISPEKLMAAVWSGDADGHTSDRSDGRADLDAIVAHLPAMKEVVDSVRVRLFCSRRIPNFATPFTRWTGHDRLLVGLLD
jgi:DNA-binding NtrC family response regulator